MCCALMRDDGLFDNTTKINSNIAVHPLADQKFFFILLTSKPDKLSKRQATSRPWANDNNIKLQLVTVRRQVSI